MEYKVLLKEIESKDCLLFQLSDCDMIIDLNNEEQSDLRKLFYKIAEKLTVGLIQFSLEIDADYNKVLFKEIAEDYILKLNEEINNVFINMPPELKNK